MKLKLSCKCINWIIILLPLPIILLSQNFQHAPQLLTLRSYSNSIKLEYPSLKIELPFNFTSQLITDFVQGFPNYLPEYIGNAKVANTFMLAFNMIYYFKYTNVICRTDLSFYFNNTIYIPTIQCRPRFFNYSAGDHPLIDLKYNIYDDVICIGHQHSTDFGHWMVEIFPLFFYIPKDVLNRSIIAIPRISQFVVDCLNLLGVKKSSIIYGDDLYFYAKNLHTVKAPYCDYISYQGIINFRQKIVEYLSLDKIQPFRLVFFNRKKGMSRYLGNFDLLLETVSHKYSNASFELGIFYDRITDQIKYFNEMKFLLAVHGALMANLIFMQADTYVIEIQMEHVFFCFLRVAVFTGKKIVVVRDRSISYRAIQDNLVNISIIMPAVESVMKNVYGSNTFKRVYIPLVDD